MLQIKATILGAIFFKEKNIFLSLDLKHDSYFFHIFSWTITLFSSMGSDIGNTSLKIRK